MSDHVFISYSNADGLLFASHLATDLRGRHPHIKVWFDKNDLLAGEPWDTQIAEAIRACKCLIFVMTDDSVTDNSVCKDEWTWALKYKKPIIPLHFHPKADLPFRLNNLQYIEFARGVDSGISQLRERITDLDSPKGVLDQLKHRLADAYRDLRRSKDDEAQRIQAEIDELKKQVEAQQKIVDNPEAAKKQTEQNIQSGLERERQPEKPVVLKTSTKFINPPPGIAPNYFQNRQVETIEIIKFLQDDAQRLMTIVGRGGVGKTAMICRLLKHLENATLPDDLNKIFNETKVDGIVYLSESGSHHVNFANIFYDLCKLLSAGAAQELDAIYKNPQGSTEGKMRALLEKFDGARVVLLLDNLEPLVDPETLAIRDAELETAMRAFLNGPHSTVKIVFTTRVAPRALNLIQPGRQRVLTLDEGLASPYAENILRQMDSDGRIGLQSAPPALLSQARERTRGYPRALEALFAILASDRYTTLDELLEKPTPENVVQELVGEAFSRLDTNAEKVMQALAVYNCPVPPAAVDYLLAPHLPVMDSAPILQRLANMHFARKESGRFYLHPVDREYAYGLIPEGSRADILRSSGGLELYDHLMVIFEEYPELLENEKALPEVQVENRDLIIELVTAYRNLDPRLIEQMKTASSFEDEAFLVTLNESLQIPQIWTRYALTTCAANYFAQVVKPREEWKNLNDFAPQLSEFELRCAADDYDIATNVLLEISDYLEQWGHYRLMIDLHLRVKDKILDDRLYLGNLSGLGGALWRIGKTHESILIFEEGYELAYGIKDRGWEGVFVGSLANAYSDLGDKNKAIEFYEQALAITREVGNQYGEASWLGNLGNCYAELGNTHKALEYHRLALSIASETGDRAGQSNWFGNIGHDLRDANDFAEAIQAYQQSIQIGDEISSSITQNYERWGLAQTYLFQSDLVSARATIEAALKYDVPQNNHSTSALHGIIALRQGDKSAARQAFFRAIGQADEILTMTPDFYEALDAKGLALCGAMLCAEDDGKLNETTMAEAIGTFQKARNIAPHAGVVKRTLRLYDELVICDDEGILNGLRNAVEGKT